MRRNLVLNIKNDFSELERIVEPVLDFYEVNQLPESVIYAIDLAMEELLTNIISYGYKDQKEHRILVKLSATDKEATLQIEDDGIPFDPLNAKEPDTKSSVEERPIGGLGIFLIRKMTDEVKYKYLNKKNCITIKKEIKKTD